MTQKLQLAIAVAAAGLFVPLSAATVADNQHGKFATADQFIMETARGNMAEIQLGQLAEQHAASDEVKKYARRMVDDHTKANEELRDIANKKNVTWPGDLSGKQKAEYDRLSKLSGANFDRAYINYTALDHKGAVAMFEKQADQGTDDDVKEYAQRLLLVLREHLQIAHQISGYKGDVERTSERQARRRGGMEHIAERK